MKKSNKVLSILLVFVMLLTHIVSGSSNSAFASDDVDDSLEEPSIEEEENDQGEERSEKLEDTSEENLLSSQKDETQEAEEKETAEIEESELIEVEEKKQKQEQKDQEQENKKKIENSNKINNQKGSFDLKEKNDSDAKTELYLDGEKGDDANDGFSSSEAVKTFEKAKEIAKENKNITDIIVIGTTELKNGVKEDGSIEKVSLAGTNAKILRGSTFNKYLFEIKENTTASLEDIEIDGNSDKNKNIEKSLIVVNQGAELTLNSGSKLRNNKIKQFKAAQSGPGATDTEGGAILAKNAAIVNLKGGIVEENAAVCGGGIYLRGSILNFFSGTVQNNHAHRYKNTSGDIYAIGGGIGSHDASTINLLSNKAEILNNTSEEIGGGIAVGNIYQSLKPNKLLMQGGKIDGNESEACGGGIYVGAQFNGTEINRAKITNGYITNNKMKGNGKRYKEFGGGGIYVNGLPKTITIPPYTYKCASGELELYNAIIKDNIAEQPGSSAGAGYAACPIAGTTVYVTDGVAIYDNNATKGKGKDVCIVSDLWHFGNHSGIAKYQLSKRMLGGVPNEWKEENGKLLPAEEYKGKLPNQTALQLHTDNGGNELTKELGKVIISGNESATRGGGIGSNGNVTFGSEGTTDVTVQKKWQSHDDDLPESIDVDLIVLFGDKEYVIETKELSAKNNWQTTFSDLPVRIGGEKAVYTVKEEALVGYISEVEEKDNHFEITNKKKVIDIPVTKVWHDSKDQDGKRPNAITVKLLANGKDTGKELTLNAENDWTGSFTDLDEYKSGKKINYTIQEVNVEGYDCEITEDATDGYTITNTHEPEKTEISGSKTWDDHDNQDGKRPKSITIRLLADGEEVDSTEVTAEDDWKWSFTDLDKYADGKEIKYTISEDLVEGYTSQIDGFDVTNSYTPGKTQVNVKKVWNDSGNQDGKRPEEIKVKLLANGKETGKKLVLNNENHWTGSFTDLVEYESGKKIDYTIEEVEVTGYKTTITGSVKTGYTITNSYTPETTSVHGSKTWKDHNDQSGKRPEAIRIRLLANGKEVDSKKVTAADNWEWSFTGLDKYDAGKLIDYTITEDVVEGYTSQVKGFDVTNSYTPGKTQINVRKLWNDQNNQDGKRPTEIRVKLLANGKETGQELILNEASHWMGSFTDLDEYESGEKINYTIKEVETAGYRTSIMGSEKSGFVIVNSYTPEKTMVQGSKTWKDDKDKAGKRPESITIRLLANGKEVDSKVVTAADGWAWTFTDLDKYEDGKLIKYTITEDRVEGYTSEVKGFDVVNSHIPEGPGPKTGDSGLGKPLLILSMSIACLSIVWNKKKKSLENN